MKMFMYGQIFADAGIMAIEHADFDGIERLALVTGGEITSTFDDPENVILGECDLIEEIMIGEDKLIHFSGVKVGLLVSYFHLAFFLLRPQSQLIYSLPWMIERKCKLVKF